MSEPAKPITLDDINRLTWERVVDHWRFKYAKNVTPPPEDETEKGL
jgi:hypothetical protein